MTSFIKHFVVKVDRTKEGTIKIGDKELFLDNEFNELQHITQCGEVVLLPTDSKEHVDGLEIGDTVYFHHFICSTENDVSSYFGNDKNTHYKLDKQNVYARKRDGKIIGLQHFILVDFIEESEDNIKTKSGLFTKSHLSRQNRIGVIRYAADESLINKVIFFKNNHDYEMTIDGKRMYRMFEGSILSFIHDFTNSFGIEELGEYHPAKETYLVEYLFHEKTATLGKIEIIIPNIGETTDGRKSKFFDGTIIRAGENTDQKPGTKIMFRRGFERQNEVYEGGKKYFLLHQDNVECVYETTLE